MGNGLGKAAQAAGHDTYFGHRPCKVCRHPLRRSSDGKCVRCWPIGKDFKQVRLPKASRRGHLLKNYNITPEQHSLMVTLQGGGCAICGMTENDNGLALAIDHCHKTGLIRGALCKRCNAGIGLLRDDPAIVRAALEYLQSERSAALIWFVRESAWADANLGDGE